MMRGGMGWGGGRRDSHRYTNSLGIEGRQKGMHKQKETYHLLSIAYLLLLRVG